MQTLQDREIQILTFYTLQKESKTFLEEQFANVGSYSGYSQMYCFRYYGKNIFHMSETPDGIIFTA